MYSCYYSQFEKKINIYLIEFSIKKKKEANISTMRALAVVTINMDWGPVYMAIY